MRHPPKVKIVGSNPAGHAMFIILWGYSMKNFIKLFLPIIALSACNSVHMHPNTLDTTQVMYADRGGYSMKRTIKEIMEKRGYNVVVGIAKSSENVTDNTSSIDIDKSAIPKNVRYIIKTKERMEYFRPIWCSLNGFWWWNFNVSIADQKTGTEILTWRGRGCVDSSVRKLDRILDALEKKETF